MSQERSIIDASSNELEIIEFYIDEELKDGSTYRSHYAMNVAKVLSIIRRPQVTGVPGKHHPAALGTFNLRDRVLPLVDLAAWLGKTAHSTNEWKVVVSEFSGYTTAFLVSGVNRIHRMTWSQVEPPGKHLQNFSHDSINGVVHIDDRIVFLLDMEQVIASMNPTLSIEAHTEQIDSGLSGDGFTILMADDSAPIRNAIAKTLQKSGFTVIKTSCGREAWEELEKIKAKAASEDRDITAYLNLIISDIEMPEMDGHALTKKIKADPAFRRVPVILFSSLISEVVFRKGRESGADDQLSKPDLPELVQRSVTLIHQFQSGEKG